MEMIELFEDIVDVACDNSGILLSALAVTVAAVATGGVALACAPAIGATVSSLGFGVAGGTLTGAAAQSAGLAALGGGSLASGGFGMAGGAAVVTVVGGATGGAVVGGAAYLGSSNTNKISPNETYHRAADRSDVRLHRDSSDARTQGMGMIASMNLQLTKAIELSLKQPLPKTRLV